MSILLLGFSYPFDVLLSVQHKPSNMLYDMLYNMLYDMFERFAPGLRKYNHITCVIIYKLFNFIAHVYGKIEQSHWMNLHFVK